MVSYNEALLAAPASRVVNPYIQDADIMDTGVPYRRERGFSALPPSNSAAAENDHQRAEMAPRLPPLRELFPEIYDGNKTARAEVADMGPFDTAGREQRQSSPYRMNGSTLGAAATETPFAPRSNAVGHVHDAPPAPVHPEHEREPRAFYDECQISRFPFDKPSNTFGDRGTSHVRGKGTQSYPSQDIRTYFSPRSKQDYVPIQNSQSHHRLHDNHSYYPHEQQYGYHHGYMQGSVSRQARHDNGHPQDHAPVDHHACDHHESSVSRNNAHGWAPINARDSRPVLTPDRTPFADRYHQESPTPAARGRKVTNNKRTAQGNTERYIQPAPKLKLKGARSKKSTPQDTKYREIQPKLDFEPKAVVVSSNKSQTPRLDALANSAAASAKPAGKRAAPVAAAPLHETWTPAPTNTTKCDVCNSRAIGSMVHQRCTECPYVICRNCVYDGKMTKLRNHKPIHVDEFNWGKMRPIQRMDKVRAAQQARALLDGGEPDDADRLVGSKKQSTESAAPFTPTKKTSQTYVTISDDDYDGNDDNDLSAAPEEDYKPPTSSERKSKTATKAADRGFSALDQYAGHVGLANSRPVRTSSINTYERMRHQATARQQIAQPDFGSVHGHGTDARKRHHDDSDDEDFEPDDVVYNPRGKRRFM